MEELKQMITSVEQLLMSQQNAPIGTNYCDTSPFQASTLQQKLISSPSVPSIDIQPSENLVERPRSRSLPFCHNSKQNQYGGKIARQPSMFVQTDTSSSDIDQKYTFTAR